MAPMGSAGGLAHEARDENQEEITHCVHCQQPIEDILHRASPADEFETPANQDDVYEEDEILYQDNYASGMKTALASEDGSDAGQDDTQASEDQTPDYAIVWHTAFVALCDGETVVLVEFDEGTLPSKIKTNQV